jgi:hypothetical protein
MKFNLSKRIFVIVILILPLLALGQHNKKYRWEAGVDLGASNFLGDLGGANQIGTHFVKDLELSLTHPAAGVHLRYRSNRYIGFRGNFDYGKVSGNDALTKEPFRNNRNLNFKSNIYEFSAVLEFYISKERPGHVYNYKKLKGWRHIDVQTYGFLGLGGFYYNPKGFYMGRYYNLREFHTEGEGLVAGTKTYSNFSVCIPMGIGFKYALNRQWSVGVEYGLRLTFTDYIDDCSTVYVDPAIIAAAQSNPISANLATHFANPQLGTMPNPDGIDPTGVNQQRGDSTHTDSYMFMQITVNYKIGKLKKTTSKF